MLEEKAGTKPSHRKRQKRKHSRINTKPETLALTFHIEPVIRNTKPVTQTPKRHISILESILLAPTPSPKAMYKAHTQRLRRLQNSTKPMFPIYRKKCA
jgi:hypothetical protein